MPHALLVEDDAVAREALAELVALEGFTISTAGSVSEARAQLAERSPDLLLADLNLPDGSGLDVVRLLDGTACERVLVTGNASVDTAIAALRMGVADYLTKPLDVPRLKAILAHVSRTRELQDEITSLRGELRQLGRFGLLVGASPPMQTVYDLLARVAPTAATVLITGESGTGKELVAETVHRLSPRRKGPYVPFNCAAVSPSLIESELFGHERGSFTGASRQHRGVFERASGGTLFLDELTEMPIELQAKLLRVLETSSFTRVGGERAITTDVRIIAATNRSLRQAVIDGKLREDLLYRLSVFPIQLPPLSERGRDVELLAQSFVEALNQAEGSNKRLGQAALSRLARHSWPGNVRELKNVIQRAFILADREIDASDLLPPEASIATATAAGGGSGALRIEIGTSLAETERRLIEATLAELAGDKRRTAEVLGISLKTLYNKLNSFAREGAGDNADATLAFGQPGPAARGVARGSS